MPPGIANFSKEIVRPVDLLHLTFDFHNLILIAGSGGTLQLARAQAGAAYIVVTLPPQSFGEQAFFEAAVTESGQSIPLPPNDPEAASAGQQDPTPPPIETDVSSKSWLVFRVSNAALPIPYSLKGLLEALKRCELVVSDVINPSRTPVPPGTSTADQDLSNVFTAVEAPYRLVLSPAAQTNWAHAGEPATGGDQTRTELWHTRLGKQTNQPGKIDEANAPPPQAHAVWSRDFDAQNPLPPHSHEPFRMPLDARDRNEIVLLSTGDPLRIPGYQRRAIEVQQLMLSTLGAWLKAHGEWTPPDTVVLGSDFKLTVEEWRHLMTMGRDHFVRVVYAGCLFPFGHRASLVKITERKFQPEPGTGAAAAYLRTRMFIIVRQPVKEYTHRSLPFQSVTIKTQSTPNLADPNSEPSAIIEGQRAFWIRTFDLDSGQAADFTFHLSAIDRENRVVEFSAPLIFVSKDISTDDVTTVKTAYDVDARAQRDLGGQPVAFAPPEVPNDTTYETSRMFFSVDGALKPVDGEPAFVPIMAAADLDIPAVKQLLGRPMSSTVTWESSYATGSGQDIDNPGEVFLTIPAPATLAWDAQKAGGLVTPNMPVGALSRALGAVNKQAAAGGFPTKSLLPDILILGGINLADILADMTFFQAAKAKTQIPNLRTYQTKNAAGQDVMRAEYKWVVRKRSLETQAELLLNTGLFVAHEEAELSLESTVDQPLDGSAPSSSVTGSLTHFDVVLVPEPKALELVALQFESITFSARDGLKVDVAIKFKGMQFRGVLEFVNALSKILPLDGFQDPPYLDVIPPPDARAGINVGYTLGLPDIGVGAFTLQNISLTAGFYLPFVGQPMNMHLAFCQREQPFILTVYGIGGGGFVGLDIGLGGVTMLETSLEFGASIALNLGIAAGAVTIMGGFYYQKAGDGFTIAAFIRAVGAMEVLGLITVSVEFYIALAYTDKASGGPHAGTLYGQASLSIKIMICFFSKKVSVSMERELAGSDPKFVDQYTPAQWISYCGAFDDYPAGEVL